MKGNDKMANDSHYMTLDMIEQITRNDGSQYYELGNVELNGRAELAANRGLIKEVRIVRLNISSSTAVKTYEKYINKHYQMPVWNFKQWVEWQKPAGKIANAFNTILKENHIA